MLSYTADQALGLLSAHHSGIIQVEPEDVSTLEFILVHEYESLTNKELKRKILPNSKEDLIDFLRKNPGESFFS